MVDETKNIDASLVLKMYDIYIDINNKDEYFADVYIRPNINDKVNHTIINLSKSNLSTNLKLDKNDYLCTYIDNRNANIEDSNDIKKIFKYSMEISSIFTIIYEHSKEKKQLSFEEIINYALNEMKPFNILVFYKDEDDLKNLIDEFAIAFEIFYKINIDNKKKLLIENISRDKNKNYDIFKDEIFKTNVQKFYKHIYFKLSDSAIAKNIINTSIKSLAIEVKDFYNDCYEGSFYNYIERILCLRNYFNKSSYEYQFYNNKYIKSSLFNKFIIEISEIDRNNIYIQYKLQLFNR